MSSMNGSSGQPMFCKIEAVLMLIGISRRQFQYLRTSSCFHYQMFIQVSRPCGCETVERWARKDARGTLAKLKKLRAEGVVGAK